MTTVTLPPLPDRELLADLCRETADREQVQPFAVEKDFYLTRLIWALAQERGETLLLKGGTLLSKVDLGFRRMSEDVDLVIPWDGGLGHRGINMGRTNRVRDALRTLAPIVGLRLSNQNGESHDQGAHRIWEIAYDSAFGSQVIYLEVSMRPVLRPGRRARLGQLLSDPLIGDYREAHCWALDADEARAEKVRAACTREAIRDFYDLDQLLKADVDFVSIGFRDLVDRKLAEMRAPALATHTTAFGMTPERRRRLDAEARRGLLAVTRAGEDLFDLGAVLARFAVLWGMGVHGDHQG